jgi:acyl-coenzyme A synthetase/AMP-(fatty) acid ligase
VSLYEALRETLRREPSKAALISNAGTLDRSALEARIEARADELGRLAATAPVSLDASDPERLAVDFFGARRSGRTAVIHAEGVPPRLQREREERLSGLLPPLSSETVFFSSGSVSRGKAIPLSEDRLLISALAYPERTGIRAGDRVAVAVPVGQVFGFLRGIVNSLLVGAEVLFYAPRRDALGEADRLGATFVLLSPAQARVSAAGTGSLRLRGALTAGGPVAEAGAGTLESERGVPLRFGYGLTETAALGSRQHFDRPRRPGSSGLPAPGVRIDVVRSDETPADPGETGEIRISGRNVFRGYADPAEASPFDARGRLRTGDLGFLDEAGELHVRGREAASIRVRGRVLCAEEVEGAALERGGVSEAAAVPLGESFGLLLVAENSSDAFLRELREHLNHRLPRFARPRRLRRVESLPRGPGGKLDRTAAAKCFETS